MARRSKTRSSGRPSMLDNVNQRTLVSARGKDVQDMANPAAFTGSRLVASAGQKAPPHLESGCPAGNSSDGSRPANSSWASATGEKCTELQLLRRTITP